MNLFQKYLTLLIAVFLLHYTGNVNAQRGSVSLPFSKNRLIVIAHRGDHVKAPENTTAAIENAIKSGADYVEIDLRTTKDGRLILHHDSTVDRMTNGTGKVSELTWAEMKKLKVFNKKIPDQKAGVTPLFTEVLKLCRNQINIYLDFKDADVAEAYRQIKAAGMERQIVVYVNSPGQYKEWRDIAPGMALMTSVPDHIRTKEQLAAFFRDTKIQVVDNLTDKDMLEVANTYGVEIWKDVQGKDEGPQLWEQTTRAGVQGLQTDNLGALVKFLNENGLRNGI